MNIPQLFGEQKVDQFFIVTHRGRATLTCNVIEKWECILDRTLKCGNKLKHKITRTVGITKSHKESLDREIIGSLGFSGIAEFRSNVRAQTTEQYQFEDMYQEENEYSFESPKCGKLRILIYQLTRLFQFEYIDTRWIHGDEWKREIKEWLPKIRDESKLSKNDPSCGCDENFDTGIDGLLFIDMGRIQILEGYKQERGDVIHLNRLNQSLSVEYEMWPYEFSRELKQETVPLHLLFLAFEESEVLKAQFTPVDIVGEREPVYART